MSILRSLLLVPRNLVIALLRVYRAVISPLYGDVCRYYPSCSAYALGAVQEHGVAPDLEADPHTPDGLIAALIADS